MKIRLYFDEDSMDRALVRALRVRDVIVTTALDAGLVGRPDIEHLEHASSTGHALFTYNVGDFCGLHDSFMSQGREHSGIICCRQQRLSIGETLRRLLHLTGSLTSEQIRNRVEFLSRW